MAHAPAQELVVVARTALAEVETVEEALEDRRLRGVCSVFG